MKILHFSSAKTWRGGEQQIAYLFEELQKKDINQWIFCPKKSALADYCEQKAIPYHTYHKRFSANPLVAVQFKKLCTQLNIDLVHLHDAHSHTYAFISTFLGNKTPFVLSRRVDFLIQNSWLSYKKYNHSSIKKILSVSMNVQQILTPSIADKNKLEVVYSGIDLDRFQFNNQKILRGTYNIPKEVKIIANIAAIAPHKDYFTFVDTATFLLKKYQQVKFLIIGGDGGEEQKVKAYISEKGLRDSFILTGFRKDIPQILPEIDVFLFTSKEEGLGTSVIDALACGVPVVATSAGGIPEIIQEEENGLLAPIKDAEKLAQQVEKILINQNLREQMTENGKHTAAQFSKKIMAEKTIAIYRNILSL